MHKENISNFLTLSKSEVIDLYRLLTLSNSIIKKNDDKELISEWKILYYPLYKKVFLSYLETF